MKKPVETPAFFVGFLSLRPLSALGLISVESQLCE
jgi:hypothetical protein